MNPLKQLSSLGQSPWLDFMRRTLIGPELDHMIETDGVGGMTSNPAIFEKAIGHSDDYDDQLHALMATGDHSAGELYEALAIKDIQLSADHLKPVWERAGHRDGFVSLEVSPYLANDTEHTLAEARRLWRAVDRPNLMIKVPGTAAGVPAIETLISEGINVNVTLLFSRAAYRAVAEAFQRGIHTLIGKGGDPKSVASVASFFVSRIDSLIDGMIDKRLASGAPNKAALDAVKGRVAIANAKLAYKDYKEIFGTAEWHAAQEKGAQNQRLLWASTGTKNPAFKDTLYVDTLIGADTVNTMPPATMDAFRDHGTAALTIEEDVAGAEALMGSLAGLGISMDEVTAKLVEDGVQLFADAFDALLGAVEAKRVKLLNGALDPMTEAVPAELAEALAAEREEWRKHGKVRRLWDKDATLWTGEDEAKWLGWLDVSVRMKADLGALKALADDAHALKHVLLIGMGGSSLGPEVLAETFGHQEGKPELHVIDSTDPAQIRAVEHALDLRSTLVVVSSKSGSTLEPNILKDYFFTRMSAVLGHDQTGKRFVAVTDPGSQMEQVAKRDGFGHIFHGEPTIGGRYSVLSAFGLVPAAAGGMDVSGLVEAALSMARSCGPDIPPAHNPGVQLGTLMGVAAKHGRDKITLFAGPGIEDFGAWAEQLIAESTGKQGHGIVPVDLEPPAAPDHYGQDRLFVHLTLKGHDDPASSAIKTLEAAGHPVVRITVGKPADLGQEFFRWAIATATAGSIIGINPFNQPDVEASKIETRKLTTAYETSGALPAEAPFLHEAGIKLFADPKNREALGGGSLAEVIKAHLGRVHAGDYVALLAYIPRDHDTIAALQKLRLIVRDHRHVATCVGFGPRFLHSTGQAYKGGPNSGVFLQITHDHAEDLAVPGHKYGFGIVQAAQARGDFDVLAARGRRALRVHLGTDVASGLEHLQALVRAAVS